MSELESMLEDIRTIIENLQDLRCRMQKHGINTAHMKNAESVLEFSDGLNGKREKRIFLAYTVVGAYSKYMNWLWDNGNISYSRYMSYLAWLGRPS